MSIVRLVEHAMSYVKQQFLAFLTRNDKLFAVQK